MLPSFLNPQIVGGLIIDTCIASFVIWPGTYLTMNRWLFHADERGKAKSTATIVLNSIVFGFIGAVFALCMFVVLLRGVSGFYSPVSEEIARMAEFVILMDFGFLFCVIISAIVVGIVKWIINKQDSKAGGV